MTCPGGRAAPNHLVRAAQQERKPAQPPARHTGLLIRLAPSTRRRPFCLSTRPHPRPHDPPSGQHCGAPLPQLHSSLPDWHLLVWPLWCPVAQEQRPLVRVQPSPLPIRPMRRVPAVATPPAMAGTSSSSDFPPAMDSHPLPATSGRSPSRSQMAAPELQRSLMCLQGRSPTFWMRPPTKTVQPPLPPPP